MPTRDDEDEQLPTELRRLFVREISLVDRPANKRRFLLFKSADSTRKDGERIVAETLTPERTKALSEALNREYASEDQVLAEIEKLTDGKLGEGARDALKGALRMLETHREGLGAETISKIVGLAFAENKPVPETPPATPPPPGDDVAKADAELAKRDAKIEALEKRVAEDEKFRADTLAKQDADEAEALVTAMNLPGMSRDDQVKLVKSFTAEQRAAMKQWGSALGTVLRSRVAGLTTEIGTPRRDGEAESSPNAEIMARAKALVAKSADGKLDLGDALLKVRADDPELAERGRLESLGIGG